MSATPLFQARVDWTDWAQHAETRECEAGCGTFRPNHPRRKFCGQTGCAGRKPSAPRRRRPSGRAQAQARAAGIQGFIGEVLADAHSIPEDPTGRDVGNAFLLFVRAERAGNAPLARRAAVRLCALGAARAVLLMPPSTDPVPDPPGYQENRR